MEQKELRELENRCIQEQPPGCTAACPIHIDVRGMVGAIGKGDFSTAVGLLRKTLPFPGIISRVCDQPCRDVCKRGEVGDAISIANLERACLDWAADAPQKIAVLPPKTDRVAIVGGGLSGLTAAFDLAKKGYPTVVFEKGDQLGGSLWHLSRERLPQQVIEDDLKVLEKVGVTVKLGVEVGQEPTLEALQEDFAAVYLAPGRNPEPAFELDLDARQQIGIDAVTFATSRPGVFAGGSVRQQTGTPSPIQSVGDGRRAALSIDRYLQNVSLTAGRSDKGSYTSRLYTSTEGVEPLPVVTMPDVQQSYGKEEAVREAGRCLQCECLECVKVCEYLNAFRSYPKKYVREIYNNLSIVMGHRHANKLINSCSLCGLCKEVCPGDLHMGLVCKEAREALVKMGKMPPSAHDFPLRDMLFSNSEKCSLVRHQPGTTASRAAFFPGCQLSASAPQLVQKVYTTLTQKLTGGVGLTLKCCGAPADWSGRAEQFQETLQDFSAQWQEMGRPQLILACSTCYEVFKTHLPEIPIVSLYELLDELGFPEQQSAPGKPAVVAVHDACTSRHEPHIQASVRRLLGRLGVTIEELSLSGERTECCGYGGLMFFANPDLAKEAIRRRIEESPRDYVAYCAMCRDYFASQGKRTLHLLDLLFDSGVEEAGARRGPGYSQRHENRVHLKNSLLKELWGESVAKQEEYETIQLVITDEVRETMEQRLILVEDLQQVIRFAETTGYKLQDPKTGHFIAHHKPTSVTYWVEYSAQGEGFVIHNAYSHRMEIVEELKP